MSAPRNAQSNPLRICFVGDSYVDGTGDPQCLGWVGRVCQMAWRRDRRITNYNIGIRGETSTRLAKRWRDECEIRLPPESPALLVFQFGINDIAVQLGAGRRVELRASIDNARKMLSEASHWRPALWIGPPPANEACCPQSPMPGISFDFRNDHLLELNAGFRAVASELNVPFLDIATPLSVSPSYLKSLTEGDRIHCSADGYEEIARLVDQWPAWRAVVDRGA